MAAGGGHLLERVNELAALDESLQRARAGHGALTLVEGPPGIGKTELLEAAVARARQLDMRVLSARGGELELSFPYAVVRQLFERTVTQADNVTRDRLMSGAAVHAQSVMDPQVASESDPVESAAVHHGLYWLTANLATDRPLLLVVDDLHWGDPGSLTWLVYLARRIEGIAVALVAGGRPAEPGADGAALEHLRRIEGAVHLRPAALSVEAVGRLARSILGDQVQQAFSQACHSATGGNAFYVTELLRALRDDRVPGSATSARAIEGLTPGAVVDATLARLGRLPSEQRAVAEAVALLEPRAELRWIAELTGLDVDAVAVAADELLRLGLLRSVASCRFAHPILRSAVESEISPARRGHLHLQAARALTAAAMPVDEVAAQLMQTPSIGEQWVVGTMKAAAQQASIRGAPAGAVAYLQRALAERPPAHERRELLLELGKAESQLHSAQAAGHLREALTLAQDADEVAIAALWLAQALYHDGATHEAHRILSEIVDRHEEQPCDAMLELEAYLISIAGAAGTMAETAERADRLAARAARSSLAMGAVEATIAFRDVLAGQPRERVRERVERALTGIERSFSGRHAADRQAPAVALVWIDEVDRAVELFDVLIGEASRSGRVQTFEIFSAMRGWAVQRRGDLADAAADIEPIRAASATRERVGLADWVALITQVHLCVDDGRPEAGEELARDARIPPGFQRGFLMVLLRQAEAGAQLAQRRFGDAAVTLRAVGEICEANGFRSPAAFPWRSALGLALAGTGRHAEAVKLARTELHLAERCDVDRARGVALRALGLLEGGEGGLQHLVAAVQTLQRTPARLELGWANYELGAALRRANRRRDARGPLDRALDLALDCRAQLLAQRTREELQALGARPRNVMLTGVQSLTASERRVCRLAAEGLRNADIAQALFVSLRTVETHLGNSYRKLDIASRGELKQALAADVGTVDRSVPTPRSAR